MRAIFIIHPFEDIINDYHNNRHYTGKGFTERGIGPFNREGRGKLIRARVKKNIGYFIMKIRRRDRLALKIGRSLLENASGEENEWRMSGDDFVKDSIFVGSPSKYEPRNFLSSGDEKC